MKREPFVEARRERWDRFERALVRLEGLKRKEVVPGSVVGEFSRLYREVCADLALVRHRRFGRELDERLNDLALRGHHQLYRRTTHLGSKLWEFAGATFPRSVRANARWVGLSTLLFVLPFAAMILAGHFAPHFLRYVLDPATMEQVEDMYDPAKNPMADGRASIEDVKMFAFYIYNNGGIALRTFASALLFGIGAFFFITFNGLMMGAVLGHLGSQGLGPQVYPFIAGHGSFELTAIVLSGAAGLKVGLSALAPGRRTRTRALAEAARSVAPIVVGMFAMILIAAFIEGFWSPSSVSPRTKYTVGAALWLLVLAYFTFAGRRTRAIR